jgi:hypothetical protein
MRLKLIIVMKTNHILSTVKKNYFVTAYLLVTYFLAYELFFGLNC